MKNEKSNLPEKKKNTVSDPLLHIQASVNLIPIIGGTISTYLGEIRGNKTQERIETFISYISNELIRLDKIKLDNEYLQSEEFAEIFIKALNQASSTTSSERIKRFANAVINNALASKEARQRVNGILELIDRISDFDAFIILCFGSPELPSLRAESRAEALALIKKLSTYLSINLPEEEGIIDSLFFLDNLGLTWVTQREIPRWTPSSEKNLRELSVFRSPLGDAVAGAIAPDGFYIKKEYLPENPNWPEDMVNKDLF